MIVETIDLFARWLHIASVVVWMGHNWANLVQQPRYRPALPAGAPPGVAEEAFQRASKREHAVFRYASLVALSTGLFMLWVRGLLADALELHGPAAAIGLGAWLGIVMASNVWVVLWPHQRKVLGFTPASFEERVRCTRVTFLSSRTNSILSIPTLYLMVAGAHGVPILFR